MTGSAGNKTDVSGGIRGLVFYTALRYHSGMATETIDRLARKLAEAVPEGIRSVRDDLEENFRSVLHSGLSKLDLVTREEFDVQQAVLARTREKLEALELRLKLLEEAPVEPSSGASGDEST